MPERTSILLLAGEASGDYHAAEMVRHLKRLDPSIEITGIGGDALASAGMELLSHYRDVNTIGVSEGLGKLRNITTAYMRMKSELRSRRHRLFIPVDFPDVNLRLCRIAKKYGIPVCYFISPQIWAWRKGRIKKILQRVDRMMTIFPFEEEMYKSAGLKADFVGHTMVRDIPAVVDQYELRRELALVPHRPVITLAPGSRPAEVKRILPIMGQAAQIYAQRFPETQFVIPLAGDHLKEVVSAVLGHFEIDVSIVPQQAAKCMGAADAGIVTSGTATLQAALVGMPHVVVYRLDPVSWFIARRILKPLVMAEDLHVAIANVLSIKAGEDHGPLGILRDAGVTVRCLDCGRRLFVPELLQGKASADALADWLITFITDPHLAQTMKKGFLELRRLLTPASEDLSPAAVVMEYLQQDTGQRRD